MKKLTLIFALFFIGLTAQVNLAQDKPNDKETLIKVVRFLEEKPFDKDAKKYREWGFLYVVETKDVSVLLCTDAIKPAMEKKNKNSGELLIHFSLAMAAFKLENPDKADDEIAAQIAGIESMLKSYEAMVREKPKAKFAGMDELVEKRNNNTLAAHIQANSCKKDKK